MSENESMTDYLAENPKMIGVLFTVFLLLSQTGNAAGALGQTVAGP